MSDRPGPGSAAPEPAAPESRAPEPATPVLRVVKGDPTAEELAALLTVLAARQSGPGRPAPGHSSAWIDRRRATRRPLHPAPCGWRDSARPR